MNRATSITNLPNSSDQIPKSYNNNEVDSKIVNEVFKEINDQGLFQRQMDINASMPQGNVLQPTPEQMAQMQFENQQQQQYMQQQYMMQQQQQHQQQQQMDTVPTYSSQSAVATSASTGLLEKLNILGTLKQFVLFAIVFLLVSLPFVNSLLSKVPVFTSTYVSLFVKSLVGGFVFVLLSRFV